MLGEQTIEAVRRLRRKGLTCRETAAALGSVSKSSVQRIDPGKRIKGAVKCPTCGAKVIPPCRACRQNPPPAADPQVLPFFDETRAAPGTGPIGRSAA